MGLSSNFGRSSIKTTEVRRDGSKDGKSSYLSHYQRTLTFALTERGYCCCCCRQWEYRERLRLARRRMDTTPSHYILYIRLLIIWYQYISPSMALFWNLVWYCNIIEIHRVSYIEIILLTELDFSHSASIENEKESHFSSGIEAGRYNRCGSFYLVLPRSNFHWGSSLGCQSGHPAVRRCWLQQGWIATCP